MKHSKLAGNNGHYLVIDTNVVLHQVGNAIGNQRPTDISDGPPDRASS